MTELKIKPLSVNLAWQGKRFKTPEYKAYEKEVYFSLPKMVIPEGKLEVHFTFGFSSNASDADNPVKPLMDIMQKKYGFNDSRVWRIVIEKSIVKKGSEFFRFEILPL
jgi:Holliday junction resolvase RusA-like endonuclease